MKVIIESKRKEKMIVECTECHSQLEVTREDVNVNYDRLGDTEYTYICPVCEHNNYNYSLKELFDWKQY